MDSETTSGFYAVFLCLILSIVYLGSILIWMSPHDRDHPTTIKKRFFSVFVMLFISPCFVWFGLSEHTLKETSILQILGFKFNGLLQAILLPLFLTMVLFTGPLSMDIINGNFKHKLQSNYWLSNFKDLIWIRNQIVAPFSEEYTYRSCMMPILLQSFSTSSSILMNPLFFGVSHLHHIHEKIRFGMDLKLALISSFFQFGYTTLFGIYSAYLFVRTKHFVSCFIVHAFCNHMGFPNIPQIFTYEKNVKIYICLLYVLGVILWVLLLDSLTDPKLYS